MVGSLLESPPRTRNRALKWHFLWWSRHPHCIFASALSGNLNFSRYRFSHLHQCHQQIRGREGWKPKYGLLTRPPKACPQRWGNAEWTFAVPLSVSLYMAPYHRQKGWQRSRNVERFRIWQMSKPFKCWNANASDVNWTFFDHWEITHILPPVQRTISCFFCKDTHPGFKKQSGQGHNETWSSKFHLCQERKKAKSLSISM